MKSTFIKLFTALFFGFSITLDAQPGDSEAEKSQLEYNIIETTITVDGLIRELRVDTTSKQIYILVQELKGKKPKRNGWLEAINYESGDQAWQSEINSSYISGPRGLFLSKQGDPFIVNATGAWSLNHSDGREHWKILESEIIAHPNGETLLFNDYYSTWSLIDSNTGKAIWSSKIDLSEPRNLLFPDSDFIWALEKGVHCLGLDASNLWYEKIRGVDLYDVKMSGGQGGVIGGSAVMFGALGAIVASFATAGMEPSVGSRAKNFLLEGDDLYIIGDEVQKYNRSKKLVWSIIDRAIRKGVSAIISLDEDNLLLVDYGFRYNMDGVKVRSGDPVCEFYKKADGTYEKSIILETEGFDFLKDFVMNEKSISFLGNRTLFTISLETLSTTKSREFGGAYSNIGLSSFRDPNDYFVVNDSFRRVRELGGDHLFIENTGNKVIEFDSDLEMLKVHSTEDFYQVIDEYETFKLISNSSEIVLIDLEGNRVIKDTLSSKAKFENGFLVDFQGTEVTLLDMNQLQKM
jgi:hypothetical protein